jgi:hypothetical protein
MKHVFLNFCSYSHVLTLKCSQLRNGWYVGIYWLVFFVVKGPAADATDALQAGRSRVRFPMVPLEFFIDIIVVALWPWGRLSL